MKVVRELPVTDQLRLVLKELGNQHLHDLMFVVSEERAKFLLGDNPKHVALVEVIGNFNPDEVVENPDPAVIDPVDDFVADVCEECIIPEVLDAPKKRGRKKKTEE